MFELIRGHQLNIMLYLCGACSILVFLLIFTKFLTRNRRRILIFMEVIATLLLWFDRSAYIYHGDTSSLGYVMVRLSNFMVYFITSAIVWAFNMYLLDLLVNDGKLKEPPFRLILVGALSGIGMVMAVVAAFTHLYYYFDANNAYHRGSGFILSYIIPVFAPLIQFSVIRQYKKLFSKLIYISLCLYIFVPIACGLLQIFTYGISIVNMAMVLVSISLYIFMYLDLNSAVEHAYEIEIKSAHDESARLHRLFDQTANAFVSAVEKKDDFSVGNSAKIANYARMIAKMHGMNEDECEKVYYAALLHDIGLIGIPDTVIMNSDDPDSYDTQRMHEKPIIGADILSSITEYPFLSEGAHYSHERYNGTGYPEALSGEDIPELARIIGVADAYVSMTSKKRYRDARPKFVVREALIRGAGEIYDPEFADIMVRIIDSENEHSGGDNEAAVFDKEFESKEYREYIMKGVPVEEELRKITFKFEKLNADSEFSDPSIILFDSYDGRCHDNEKTIENYHYFEYAEVWFNKYSINSGARKIEEKELKLNYSVVSALDEGYFEVIAGRFEDHIKIVMRTKDFAKQLIMALPGNSKSAFIGLTGENCRISDIKVEFVGDTVKEGDIPRIAEKLNFIDHLEADVPNIQIDRTRSASTEGIEISNGLHVKFNSMSLPSANLVWHCPYLVIYTSDDGEVYGPNYIEYNLIKINGENDENQNDYSTNRFIMKKSKDFMGWDEWMKANKKGVEIDVNFAVKGKEIVLTTETLGIYIENTTIIADPPEHVYFSITGDQVAITDIRLV